MIRNILIALDASKGSLSAQTLGLQLAKNYRAALTGIGIVDESLVETPEAIPLGGSAFKVGRDEELLDAIIRRVQTLEVAFIEACKREDVKHALIDAMGIPVEEIEKSLVKYDLLILGKDASFHFDNIDTLTSSVRQLIKDNPRPLIVTGESLPHQESSNVLVAFDGTFASSRSLHMALTMGILTKKSVHLVTIGPEATQVKDHINAAAALCQDHGLETHLHPCISDRDPADDLLEKIEKIKPSLLVLGAYTHGTLHHFFWGSTAEKVLKSSSVPAFFFH